MQIVVQCFQIVHLLNLRVYIRVVGPDQEEGDTKDSHSECRSRCKVVVLF